MSLDKQRLHSSSSGRVPEIPAAEKYTLSFLTVLFVALLLSGCQMIDTDAEKDDVIEQKIKGDAVKALIRGRFSLKAQVAAIACDDLPEIIKYGSMPPINYEKLPQMMADCSEKKYTYSVSWPRTRLDLRAAFPPEVLERCFDAMRIESTGQWMTPSSVKKLTCTGLSSASRGGLPAPVTEVFVGRPLQTIAETRGDVRRAQIR